MNILDVYSRECLASVVARRIRSQDLLLILADLFLSHEIPTHIRSDDGPEFMAIKLKQWLKHLNVTPLYIEPGSPWENGYIESFNGKMREQFLNGELFYTLQEAQILTERWRRHYYTVRPHSSLGASHLLPKPSSLRAEDSHGRGSNNSRLVTGETVMRVTLTTIWGTDLHIIRGEYPVRPGLVIGHEAVGVIEEPGSGVTGYRLGDRVLVGAITPCGQCHACLSGHRSQCGHGEGYEAIGGWRFGNTINGAQAEYLLVPYAQANLAKIPNELTDEQVIL